MTDGAAKPAVERVVEHLDGEYVAAMERWERASKAEATALKRAKPLILFAAEQEQEKFCAANEANTLWRLRRWMETQGMVAPLPEAEPEPAPARGISDKFMLQLLEEEAARRGISVQALVAGIFEAKES
jgi:hypothetical protein